MKCIGEDNILAFRETAKHHPGWQPETLKLGRGWGGEGKDGLSSDQNFKRVQRKESYK
jgi:hypothetical protein